MTMNQGGDYSNSLACSVSNKVQQFQLDSRTDDSLSVPPHFLNTLKKSAWTVSIYNLRTSSLARCDPAG